MMFDALSELSYEQTPQVSYVTFQCRFETRPGYSLYIIGNIREMGSWQPSSSIALVTNSDMYPTWKTSKPIIVPTGSEIDYKYLIKNDSGDYEWEYLPQNENRHLDIKSPGKWTIKDEKDNLFSEVINKDYLSHSQNNLLELSMFLLIYLKLKGLKKFNIVQDIFFQCFLICKQNVVIWKVLLQMCEC